MMFRGLHQHSIDAKGRTQCPARFREVLRQAAAAALPAAAAPLPAAREASEEAPCTVCAAAASEAAPAADAASVAAPAAGSGSAPGLAPAAAAVSAPAPEPAPEQLILTTGLDTCLMVYTPSAWAAFEERLAKLPQFDPAVVRLKRIYVASAAECDIDRHGRLLIPPNLRQFAGLQKDIVWAGMVTVCEIWDQATWEARLAASRQDTAAVAKVLTELGL
jgi:MraZ protein